MHGDRGTYFPASPCLHPLVFFFFFHVLGKRVLQLQVAHRSKHRDRLNGRILAQLTFANFALKCNNIYSDWCVTIDIFISIEHL